MFPSLQINVVESFDLKTLYKKCKAGLPKFKKDMKKDVKITEDKKTK